MVFEEFDAMVKSGEIDEGAIADFGRWVGRGATQAAGHAKGAMSKLGSTASALKKKGIGAALGAVGEKDAAAQMGADAAEIEKQGAQKAQMAKAATVLGKSDQTLRGAYADLAKNAQALGILDEPQVQKSMGQLQGAIADVSRTIKMMTTTQAQRNPPGVHDADDTSPADVMAAKE
ncbi:hypothetical protein CMI37_14015 [Candidatus Pacearchaeota archaeon]|nr:hypothetical protein [Candidatus Pacearchaeota archaeon]|tara:strand:- start:1263 stop:1790 length:528 start_codon:yes stop_codon:yes gene_type:complete